jgi:hypothetical protein
LHQLPPSFPGCASYCDGANFPINVDSLLLCLAIDKFTSLLIT